MKSFQRNLKYLYIDSFLLLLIVLLAACSNPHEDITEQSVDSSEISMNEEDTVILSGEEQLSELHQTLLNENMAAAVAFIGYADGKLEDIVEKYQEEQPILTLIPEERYIQFDGEEIYLIVPTDTCESVSINEWICDETNDFVGETGRVLYRAESSEPVLVRGNVSDTVSNLQVIILTANSEFLDYNPCLSVPDKVLMTVTEPPILDITVYPKISH